MKMIAGFLAGVASATAIGAAAQCANDLDLTPIVSIFDARSHQKLLDCKVVVRLLDGHRLMCDRGARSTP